MYLLSYDRAGYGESDPNPKRSVKSEAFDIQELADQLEIGPRFYVIGISMGTYAAWSVSNTYHTGMILPSFFFSF